MHQLTLLVYLRSDRLNTLASRLQYMQNQGSYPSLAGRAGVTLLSDNAVLFEQTKAHGVFVTLCAALQAEDLPYLLIPLSDTAGWMLAGKCPEAVADGLKNIGVQSV